MESITALSIWMSPNLDVFLEEVTQMFEEFAARLWLPSLDKSVAQCKHWLREYPII